MTDTGSAVPRPRTALDPSVLLGDWHNTDRGTGGGILRIIVTGHADGVRVRAFGTGDPEPRDWGEVEACTYAAQDSSLTAASFTASYDFGFLRTLIAAYYNQEILVATTHNVFDDGSGRADYWTREFFYRV